MEWPLNGWENEQYARVKSVRPALYPRVFALRAHLAWAASGAWWAWQEVRQRVRSGGGGDQAADPIEYERDAFLAFGVGQKLGSDHVLRVGQGE